jgi:hypothetical protein
MYRISLFSLVLASNVLAAADQYPIARVGLWLSPYTQTDYTVGNDAVDANGPGLALYGQIGDELHAYSRYKSGWLEGDASLPQITGTNLDVTPSEFRLGAGIKQDLGRGYVVATIEYIKAGLKVDDVRLIADEGMGFHIGGGWPVYAGTEMHGKAGVIAMGDFNGVEFVAGASRPLTRHLRLLAEWNTLLLSDSGKDFNVQSISIGLHMSL